MMREVERKALVSACVDKSKDGCPTSCVIVT
jgi:hypothetical protein